jgi:hypothetical protein
VGKKGFSFCLRDLIFEYCFDFISLQETIKRKWIVQFGENLTWTILTIGCGLPLWDVLVGFCVALSPLDLMSVQYPLADFLSRLGFLMLNIKMNIN